MNWWTIVGLNWARAHTARLIMWHGRMYKWGYDKYNSFSRYLSRRPCLSFNNVTIYEPIILWIDNLNGLYKTKCKPNSHESLMS